MVAISLYRGNLHRVPDVPRRWLMPSHSLSPKDFKSLLHRRSRALSHVSPSAPALPAPDLGPGSGLHNDGQPPVEPPEAEKGGGAEACGEGTSKGVVALEVKEEVNDHGEAIEGTNRSPEAKHDWVGKSVDDGGGIQVSPAMKAEEPVKNAVQAVDKVRASTDGEKRKKDVEEKLQLLNAKKHSLVQVLKQILNAEEELKRRSSMQGMAVRPSGPLHVDVMNDSGSMTRLNTPRMGSEAHFGGDMEGGEADDASNHIMPSRPMLRMSSVSPSPESPIRRPALSQHTQLSHPSRSSLAIGGSPSRFAPQALQAHLANLPTVSISGTNYVPSSPSPAASGGTSVFKDARLPSPWN
ncbi:hypothetical protein BT93_B0199 [Corymbia citriodora subsp. variegata]|nr:hypothetical protein BT93_B0199 [Corymbia citriodora subsp. variegata]